MTLPPFAQHVRRRLEAHAARPPRAWGATPAGVLVPLVSPATGEARVWLVRKRAGLRHHGGQVGLPGGKLEAGETPREAALREAHEEIGLAPEAVTVLGELGAYPTLSSRFVISAFVGHVAPDFRPAPDGREVAYVFAAPLAVFARAPTYRIVEGAGAWPLPLPTYEAEGETVWGATAAILRALAKLVLAPDAAP